MSTKVKKIIAREGLILLAIGVCFSILLVVFLAIQRSSQAGIIVWLLLVVISAYPVYLMVRFVIWALRTASVKKSWSLVIILSLSGVFVLTGLGIYVTQMINTTNETQEAKQRRANQLRAELARRELSSREQTPQQVRAADPRQAARTAIDNAIITGPGPPGRG